MNKLIAGDVKTFLALSQNAGILPEYGDPELQGRSDIDELRRLSEANGLGHELYDGATADDDELAEALSEIGWSPQT